MNLFKKSEMKQQAPSALRALSVAEMTTVGGGKQMVCKPGEHYYAGQCVKNSK